MEREAGQDDWHGNFVFAAGFDTIIKPSARQIAAGLQSRITCVLVLLATAGAPQDNVPNLLAIFFLFFSLLLFEKVNKIDSVMNACSLNTENELKADGFKFSWTADAKE